MDLHGVVVVVAVVVAWNRTENTMSLFDEGNVTRQ
jgi:hypothetical protein